MRVNSRKILVVTATHVATSHVARSHHTDATSLLLLFVKPLEVMLMLHTADLTLEVLLSTEAKIAGYLFIA